MQIKCAFGFLVCLVLAIGSTQAAIKNIPPLFREIPNARISGQGRADDLNYRLPNNTEPVLYEVELSTNVHSGDLAFSGTVKIHLNVLEDTKTIVLHALQLTINSATIQEATTGSVAIAIPFSYELERQFLTLTSETTLNQNTQWILTIQYNGELRKDNGGFYVSTYLDEAKNTKYLATTQFESTDARHAFPCYDEPAKRAKFAITMNHDASYNAISNMPVKQQTTTAGRTTTIFEESPNMPAYVVAFIVSDFKWTEGVLNSLPQRIYSRPGTEKEQEWALVSGMLITERLAEYYGVDFALPKLDQVAVPDFAAGAMENWGLATYREEYMLYNKEKSTVYTQTNIANIVAHEYCHQWFGNLVAIKWWTYLWLKEGFANMFSYKATDDAYPEWGIMQQFHTDEFQRALNNDAGRSPRAITHYVEKPLEISSAYDAISYSKAGSILFMWQHALTDEVFKQGMHNYLTFNQYSAAEENDLFEAIQIAAKDVNYVLPAKMAEMMSTWTRQGGYPVLTVKRDYNGTFTVTQKAYYNDETYNNEKSWYIPINYAVQSNPDFRDTEASHYLLNEPAIEINANISNDDWLILNKQSTGYYRVNYDEKNWELIINGLINRAHKIHPRNRAQLMHDAYHFSSTNRLSHKHLLNLLTYLKNEDQYAPWSTANGIINIFNRYLSGDPLYADFQKYVTELVGDIYDKLGANDVAGEHHYAKYTRSVAINLACVAGISSCLEETHNKLKDLVEKNIEIEPNLQTQIYCNGLKQSGDNEFNFVYDRLMSSQDQAQRRTLISSLGCAQNPEHIKKFIESSINNNADNTLRVQERMTLLNSAYSRGEVGLLTTIEFLDENWQEYSELTSSFSGSNPLEDDIIGMSYYVVNNEQELKLLALVDKVKTSPNVGAYLEETVKSIIKSNFDWLAKNRNAIMGWITDHLAEKDGSDGGGDGAAALSTSVISVVLAASLIVMKMF